MNQKRDWIAGGGEMGALVRSLDWSKTALGPLDAWPQSLRTIVSTCLSSRFPILIWWGPELVMVYNDALSQIIGNKHPRAMGQPGAEGWWEVWDLLGPMLGSVLSQGASTWSENQRLDIERSLKGGDLEETYFTFSYSPIRDESGGVGGVFCAVTETTAQVLSERRLHTLSTLAQQTAEVTTAGEACLRAAIALQENALDVPAAFLYLADGRGAEARLASTVGVTFPSEQQEQAARVEWPLASVLETGIPLVIGEDALQQALEGMGCRPASPPKSALLLPFGPLGKAGGSGVLVVCLSPLLLLDDRYRSFLVLVGGHIGTAIASARALEAAEHRADALAQLDRAKTAFFSNVSHEFRTPLTLMLGPTEDALASEAGALGGAGLATVHRNGLRLLRLVNTLLDFSRIEAGRAEAAFEPTDLAALTKDLAAAFRSAIERAGLGLIVECEPLDEPIHVDREMWEKIVLNLLSNALKFTFEGSIGVALDVRSGCATLVVRDSGVGIAEAELPRVFERFYRIEGTRSRTHEGTGIGLALVRDLVRLHGGDISVESGPGEGTTFTVSIPTGSAHLPADRLRPPRALHENGVRDQSFITEAMRWLHSAQDEGSTLAIDAAQAASASTAGARILLVDDNADMREYVARLLREHWPVDIAADGVDALALAQASVPSLVLTDVMMPRLDGFGLLRALRNDARTRSVPVVMLSARAGEESRVEGLGLGADDYLVKPFSAKELVARVKTHLELGGLRSAAEAERNRLYSLFEQAPAAIAVLRGPAFVYELANPRYRELVQRPDIVGKALTEVFPEVEGQPIHDILHRVYATGERFVGHEFLVQLARLPDGKPEDIYFDLVYEPFRAADGSVDGIMVLAFEVTQRARSARERERLLAERETLLAEREGLLLSEREARADVERALRAKDEFLAMLGHELRNPLAPIVSALQLLRLRGGQSESREHTIIERQIKHLTTLVDDLLDVSAITRGKIELKRERIELNLLLDRAAEIAGPLLDQRRHDLIVKVPRHGLLVEVDATRMTQVVSNLLTNAAKYTEVGGRIVVSAAALDNEVELRVTDNGIGISEEMLPHVFELFMQEHQAIDRAKGGLGLGLAIVQNLMRMHAGTVSAASNGRGMGSTFTIRLPAVVAAAEHRREAAESAPSPATRTYAHSVLIVDDNADAAETLAMLLRGLGCDARTAESGRAALALVASFKPELALLDIGLPEMDGYELARRLRAIPDLARMRMVAVTGYGQKGDIVLAMKAGFDEHLVKPLDFEKLEALLGRSFAKEAARSEPACPLEPVIGPGA
ncbi:MAG: ATP-binding protein [Pseudomonadota bacterium]|nr:ATP-binding protein [Pseudomonadota bacterium]